MFQRVSSLQRRVPPVVSVGVGVGVGVVAAAAAVLSWAYTDAEQARSTHENQMGEEGRLFSVLAAATAAAAATTTATTTTARSRREPSILSRLHQHTPTMAGLAAGPA
jgi:TctA family transporter